MESEVLEKLWDIGILKKSREQGAGLSGVENEVTVSSFARRRLGVVMTRMGMVETVPAVSILLCFPSAGVSLAISGWSG